MQEKKYTVSKEEMGALPYIIAIDFDGTLVKDNYPDIGPVRKSVVRSLWRHIKNLKAKGEVRLILNTCRDGAQLDEAVAFCENELGWKPDAVNRNIDEVIAMFNNDTRKVYANEYWDDKAHNPDIVIPTWLGCECGINDSDDGIGAAAYGA